jgi:hypothetical protein
MRAMARGRAGDPLHVERFGPGVKAIAWSRPACELQPRVGLPGRLRDSTLATPARRAEHRSELAVEPSFFTPQPRFRRRLLALLPAHLIGRRRSPPAWNAAGGIVCATLVGPIAYYLGNAAAKAIGTYGLHAPRLLGDASLDPPHDQKPIAARSSAPGSRPVVCQKLASHLQNTPFSGARAEFWHPTREAGSGLLGLRRS